MFFFFSSSPYRIFFFFFSYVYVCVCLCGVASRVTQYDLVGRKEKRHENGSDVAHIFFFVVAFFCLALTSEAVDMKSATTERTVAEQVAALPPLSQLLGIDEVEQEHAPKSTGRAARRPTEKSSTRSRAGHKEAKQAGEAATPSPSPASAQPAADEGAPSKGSASRLPLSPAKEAATPLSPACYPGGLREWRHVQSTLQLPLAYRGEDDIKLTLRLLRSLPLFSALLDHDLLTLAEAMSITEVANAGTVLLRKRATPARTATADVTSSVAPSAPSAFAGGPSLLPSDDDDDGATAARPSWMIPASELFQHFRAQMAQGDQPSLPAACLAAHESLTGAVAGGKVSSNSGGKGSIGEANAPEAYAAAVSSSQVAAELKTPLFYVPKGWQDADDDDDAEEPFALVLLSGHCELRWPRQRCPAELPTAPSYYTYSVQPGDTMGYALVWAALPAGAEYVTCDTCTLLKVGVEGQARDVKERLHRACRRANEMVYKAQRSFLTEKLLTPLFAEASADDVKGATAAVAATHDASADPPVEALLDLAARELIPVRVPGETTLLQEGLCPATECALYFVVEGTCVVVRRLWSQDRQRLEARKTQLLKELTPPNGVRPALTTMPSTTAMEVAQLRPGDYCGDIAYLRIDPDNAASIDAEWTSAYWQSTFVPSAAAAAEKEAEESALASNLRTRRQQQQSANGGRDENTKSKSLFRRHKASVVTQRSTQLLVLLPTAAAEVVRGVVLERMIEHARVCPSYTSLLAEYEKLYRWAIYKEKVLWEQSKKAPVPLR